MKIIKAVSCDQMGGNVSAVDIHFDNGFSLRIVNGNEAAFLFHTPNLTALHADPISAVESAGEELQYVEIEKR
jgi:hypothetical protein